MSDIAKSLADRIRIKAASGDIQALPKGGTFAERDAWCKEAVKAFEDTYGIPYAAVTGALVTGNDLLHGNAEEGIPVAEFVHTVGTQFSLSSVADFDAETARYMAGENAAKVALREFCFDNPDWTFADGYAVHEHADKTTVLSASFDDFRHGWQVGGCLVACDKETYLDMSVAEKAGVPTESHYYGDIGECATHDYAMELAPAALRM